MQNLTITKKDLIFQYFRAGGPGGQNQNKTDSACRIVHKVSGAVAESREHRTQLENKRAAFKRLAQHPKLREWINIQMGIVDETKETPSRRYTYRPPNVSIETRKMDRE